MINYSLSIGIVCVPSRLHYAKKLLSLIGNSNAFLSCDIHYQGSWFGTRQAWVAALRSGATHVMEIEEDVLPCLDFYETSLQIIKIHPTKILSFYSLKSEKTFCAWARSNESSYYQYSSSPSGQCVIMPRNIATAFINFCDKFVTPETKYEDVRLWGFMRVHNLTALITVPNLVEHVGNMESTLGFNSKGKTSADFIGAYVSGLSVDWKKDNSSLKIFRNAADPSYRKSFLAGFSNPGKVKV